MILVNKKFEEIIGEFRKWGVLEDRLEYSGEDFFEGKVVDSLEEGEKFKKYFRERV